MNRSQVVLGLDQNDLEAELIEELPESAAIVGILRIALRPLDGEHFASTAASAVDYQGTNHGLSPEPVVLTKEAQEFLADALIRDALGTYQNHHGPRGKRNRILTAAWLLIKGAIRGPSRPVHPDPAVEWHEFQVEFTNFLRERGSTKAPESSVRESD